MSSMDTADLRLYYNVMYYKRAQASKVHRDKGVTKLDGQLTVDSAPATVTLQSVEDDNTSASSEEEEEDVSTKLSWNKRRSMQQKKKKRTSHSNSKVLYSGVQREICKRTLQENDVVVLGGFEVQIIDLRNSQTEEMLSQQQKTSTSLAATKKSLLFGAKKPLIRSTTCYATVPIQPKRAVIPTSVVRSTSEHPQQPPTITRASAKPIYHMKKKAPAQLQPQLPSQKAILTSSVEVKVQLGSILSRKRPLLSSKNTAATKQHRFVAQQPPSSITGTTSTLSADLITTNAILPHIPLPASIRNVLLPHQVVGVDFLWTTLAERKGCILGDEMGLGQFVVVCPSSLVSNWATEFDKWLGRASQPKRVVICKGGEDGLRQIRAYAQKMKQQLMHQPGQVLIVSYDLFRRNSDEFIFPENVTVGLLVVDEGHRLKNSSGSLTLAALESLPADARLCITATPIQNNLCEFYKLANFCCPEILGTDLASFRKNYERPIAAANQKNASSDRLAIGLAKSKELETVSKSFMLRRLQKDVLTTMLPPRTEALLFCRPSALQRQLYRSLTTHTITGNKADALTTLTALRKICSHPSLHKTNSDADSVAFENVSVTLSGKMMVLDALLREIHQKASNDKVVIVSNFTQALSSIESFVLKPRLLSYLRLDGSTPNRQALVDTFNRTRPESSFCLLLSSKAGGCGLNITGANRLVMFDNDWNPSVDVQAMGRIYRQGQTKPCTIYRLFTAGTVEEVIYQRQHAKGRLATLTVDAGTKDGKRKSKGGNAASFTKEEIADCFTLKENCACDTKQKVGKRWPSYDDGAEGLRASGCTDIPLLSVAKSMSDILCFVHIANDAETLAQVPGVEDASGDEVCSIEADENQGDFSSDSENEFEL